MECYEDESSRDSAMGHVVETDTGSLVLLNVPCSETFRRALDDDAITASITISSSSSSMCEPVTTHDQDLREDDQDANDEQVVVEATVRQTAGRRAWHRLRVYVDEQARNISSIYCLSNALHSSIGQIIKSLENGVRCPVNGVRCPISGSNH